jgi:hypothetical protein
MFEHWLTVRYGSVRFEQDGPKKPRSYMSIFYVGCVCCFGCQGHIPNQRRLALLLAFDTCSANPVLVGAIAKVSVTPTVLAEKA